MTFGEAHAAVMRGHLVTRMAWSAGTWLRLCRPEETDTVTIPMFVLDRPSDAGMYPGGIRTPYTPTAEDMIWPDWKVVE